MPVIVALTVRNACVVDHTVEYIDASYPGHI